MPDNRETNVIVVDDDESMRIYLKETLTAGGYGCRSFPDGAAALGWLANGEERVDLLLSDINMAGINGLDLLKTVKTVVPDLPFILISGMCDLPMARDALRKGANEYLLKPVVPADLLSLVAKYVDTGHSETFEAVRQELNRALATTDIRGRLKASQAEQLLSMFEVVGFKRLETIQHSRRVAAYALLIARGLRLEPDAAGALEVGSLLHDIGKAGIPLNVLMKPGKLDDEEWAIMKMHPQLGADLLYGLSGLDLEVQLVYSHHERFDGKGYPRQLAGEAIPRSARIFSVADTLDAITTDRCYRRGQGLPAARAEIHRNAGTQFDPAILALFDRVSDEEFEAVQRQFPDA
jgi:response regulator RpfG family c-di-GMP phosphodiesterase